MSIFLITGASGSGKTTVMYETRNTLNSLVLINNIKNNLGECISHTTRKIREDEEDGETYYFINNDVFSIMKEKGEFAEYVVYDKNNYGISKEEIERVLQTYKHVYIIVNYDGYKQVKEAFPESIGIFIHMTEEDCLANMLLRGDSKANAMQRISTYQDEMKNRHDYDYVIKNVRGKMDKTVKIIKNIILQNE